MVLPLDTASSSSDDLFFFEEMKRETELFWQGVTLNKRIYGFQVQPGTRWRPGLSEAELLDFEKALGFELPLPLKNFYWVMNGLDKPGINIYGTDGTMSAYRPLFYAYPDDVSLIQEQIEWIYEETAVPRQLLGPSGISRIFPVTGHRFMMIDTPGHPILSMYGEDIIYWADGIGQMLRMDVFDKPGPKPKISSAIIQPLINFWLDPRGNQ